MVFIEFWKPGDIPYRYGSRKILTCLDCITGFGIGSATRLKEITSYRAAQWDFGNLFVPFGIPKMIVVDADGIFSGIYGMTFQENLLIPVHTVTRGKHKTIINELIHRYLTNLHEINSEDKEILHQWLQGVLFVLYAWNAGPVDGMDIA